MARIHDLAALLKEAPDEVFIQPHNVPDPDAIASCFGLQQLLGALGVPAQIIYEDEIEKANSLAMLNTFGITMRHSAEVTPERNVAAALLYGIFMDTSDLTRGTSPLDIDMFYWLYSLADISLITQLKGSELSLDDLKDYARAFESVEVYDQIGFLPLENGNDSLLGAASDIVTSVAGVNVVVSYAIREGGVKYSTRSITPAVNAADLVRAIVDGHGVGGGHDGMAGGFIKRERLPAGRSIDTFTRVRAVQFVDDAFARSEPVEAADHA